MNIDVNDTKVFAVAVAVVAVMFIMITGIAILDKRDWIEINWVGTNWTKQQVSRYLKENSQIDTVVKTNQQIVIKPDSELDDMLIVYTGDKSPVCIKEEEFVSRTGIRLTIINPNRIKDFVTQY